MLFLTNIDWAWNIAKKLYIWGYGLNENPILFCGYSASKWLRVLRILLKFITKRITTFFCIESPINWLQIFGEPNRLLMRPCPLYICKKINVDPILRPHCIVISFFSYTNSRYCIRKAILWDPDENIPFAMNTIFGISTRFVIKNKKVQKSI